MPRFRLARAVPCAFPALACALIAPVVHAQISNGWSPAFSRAGVAGTRSPHVEEVCAWNGDLYVGGAFETAGDILASTIARWDGQRFHALDGGLDCASQTCGYREMVVHDGALVVAGDFTSGSGQVLRRIARWDGAQWSPFGEGMNATVDAVGVHEGALLAGGIFSTSGGVHVSRLALWTGAAWVPFAEVTGYAVLAIGHLGPDLVIGGSFTAVDGVPCANIARFDGTSWHALGDGTNGWVWSLAELNGELYAGGDFTRSGALVVNRIARWDGITWNPVGDGFSSGRVKELLVFDGNVFAAGSFQGAGGVRDLAYWNGSAWLLPQPTVDNHARSLALWNGGLAVGGEFVRAGTVAAQRVATWAGGAWTAFGSGQGIEGGVHAIETYGDAVVFGGSFSWAGPTPVANISAWNRVEHLPLGEGLDDAVNALQVWNGLLVAGGSFQNSGGQGLSRVAAWNGSAWAPMGAGLPGSVNALTTQDGALLAGGSFALGPDASRVARWTGTSWEPVTWGPNGTVMALAEFGGELFAGGDFPFAGQEPASHVAAWTGSHWRALGRGRQHEVNSLTVHDDHLVVVGTSSWWWYPPLWSVGLWSGSAWIPLPSPYPGLACRAAGTYRGDLMIGGSDGEGGALHRLAGETWTDLDGEVSGGPVLAIRQVGNELFVGGTFTIAGEWVSLGIARYVGFQPRTAAAGDDHPGKDRAPTTPIVVPTPYSPGMRIRAEGHGKGMGIYDVRGRLVRELLPATSRDEGTAYRWDGRASDGSPVATGMYFIRFRDGGATKLLLRR